MSERQLSDLAELTYGKSPNGFRAASSSIPLYGTSGVVGYATRAMCNSDAVVLPRKGSLGNPRFANAGFWAIDTTYVATPRDGIDAKWLYYALSSFDLTKLNEATGVPSISRDWLSKLKIGTPALGEQRRIADLLSAVDEQVERLESEAAKETMRSLALLQAALPEGFAVNNPPKGHLADALLRIEAGKSFMCSDMPAPEGAWGVLKVSAVRPEGFLSCENKQVEDLALVNPRYEVADGDLLMTRANTPELVGAASYVVAPQRRLLLCDKTLRLRPKSEVLPQYLWLWLQTPVARRHVEAHATGTSAGMKNISQAAIRSLPLMLPAPDEQAALVRTIVALYEHIHCLRTSSSKLRKLKSGLAARLLIPGDAQEK